MPYLKRGRDYIEKMVFTVLFGTIIFLGVTFAAIVVDGVVFEYAAFDATTACEANRMDYRRKFLSSHVVCIPAYRQTRNDTLSVNLNK